MTLPAPVPATGPAAPGAHVYLITGRAEIERRRQLVDRSRVVEVWPDLHAGDLFWLGDEEQRRVEYARPAAPRPGGLYWLGAETRGLLEESGGPLPVALSIPESAVPIYYGPALRDLESLPAEASLRARVLSGHGVAVLWTTYDRSGRRNEFQPASPLDPSFHLRRPRTGAIHLWRLFSSRADAERYVADHLSDDPEALRWARAIPAADFQDLVERLGDRPAPPPGKSGTA